MSVACRIMQVLAAQSSGMPGAGSSCKKQKQQGPPACRLAMQTTTRGTRTTRCWPTHRATKSRCAAFEDQHTAIVSQPCLSRVSAGQAGEAFTTPWHISNLPLQRMQQRVLQWQENLHIKTIANMAYMLRPGTPHDATFAPGRYAGAPRYHAYMPAMHLVGWQQACACRACVAKACIRMPSHARRSC